MNKDNGIASKFSCDRCGKIGTLYLDNETKAWYCEICHFNKKATSGQHKKLYVEE